MESAPEQQVHKRCEEILEAARELFFEKGYRATTIQQIAARAGYSKRTVYLDYRSKDELFASVCIEGGQMLLDFLTDIPDEELTIGECIEQYLAVFIDFSRDHTHYFRMIFSEATPEIVDSCANEVKHRLASLERACLAVISKLAERAVHEGHIPPVDPWATAGIFVGTATGIILLSTGGMQTIFTQQSLESLANKAILTFWAGLRTSAALEKASQEKGDQEG